MRCVTTILIVCAVAIWSPALRAQDQPAPDPAAPQDDARTALKKGLEESAKSGGFAFEGRVDQENPMAMVGGMMGGSQGGLDGKFSGVVGTGGAVSLRFENKGGTYELFKKGDKIIQRQTWTGKQQMVGAFPQEMAAILDLAGMVKYVNKAKSIRRGEAKSVAGSECAAYKTQFGPGFVPDDDDDDAGALMKFSMFELKKVDATVYLSGDSSQVRRLDITLTRSLSNTVRAAAAGMAGGRKKKEPKEGEKEKQDDEDEDEDEAMPGLGNLKAISTYSVTVNQYGGDVKAEIPADVLKLLGE